MSADRPAQCRKAYPAAWPRFCSPLTLAGALAGVVVGWLASGTLEGLLFGVKAGDPLTMAGTVGVVMAASIVASYAPTRRILRHSPASTLRDG